MNETHEPTPWHDIRSDDELLDAVGRGERITQNELGRIMAAWRSEALPKDTDAYAFFANELPDVKDRAAFDLTTWLLRVLVVIEIVGIAMVLTGILWAAVVCLIGAVVTTVVTWKNRKSL